MEKAPEKTKQVLASLLGSQKLAVLSTYSGGQPYVSIVAFATSEDMGHLFFVTARATRKFANILEHPQIALLVDNRSNKESDFGEAIAVTILGEALELAGKERETRLELYLRKHPYLREFATSASCAILQVKVEDYIMVSNFQAVTELRLQTRSFAGNQ